MGLQSLSRLLQHGHRQVVGGGQTQRVAVVADLSMRPPGPFGDASLMMRRQAAHLSHKAKRGLRCQPAKPRRRIGSKREQTLLGTDHHVVPRAAVLDQKASQRFGIDAEASCRLDQREEGHRVPPFVWGVQ